MNKVIPQIKDATDIVCYRSHIFLEGYDLKSPQPRYFGWFDLDSGRGCHYTAKLFLGEKWVLGRHIIATTRNEFLRMQAIEAVNDVHLDVDEFKHVLSSWLEAAGQTRELEWWLQEA